MVIIQAVGKIIEFHISTWRGSPETVLILRFAPGAAGSAAVPANAARYLHRDGILGVRKLALLLTRILHLASGFRPNGHVHKAKAQTQMPGRVGRAGQSPTGDLGSRFAESDGVLPAKAAFSAKTIGNMWMRKTPIPKAARGYSIALPAGRRRSRQTVN